MIKKRGFVFILIMLLGISGLSQSPAPFVQVKDLKPEWLVYKDNAYSLRGEEASRTIYFNLSANAFKGDWISIHSVHPMNVFINGQLVARKQDGTILMGIDSLAKIYSPTLTVAVFQKEGNQLLRTEILSRRTAVPETENSPHTTNAFLNFAILAVLMLSGFFVFLFQSNPKLTLDYFNVTKLVSIQEREDNLMATRITSSVNLLFYLYVSGSCSLALLTLFHFGAETIAVAHGFQIHTTAEGFYQWIRLIVIVSTFLGLKLLVIYGFSVLFNLRDTTALQFFNFIRMLFFIVTIIVVVVVGSFMYNGYPTGPHVGLLKMSLVLISFSVVMIFLKLSSFTSFSFFHLFSYLCASEIIPLVILLRVLLY